MDKGAFDFSGYVTRTNIKCSDGRTILKDAFKDCDGQVVPLLWHHFHDDPKNVLGNVTLEAREDGVYGYGRLNDTDSGRLSKQLLKHGDIKAMSIHANQLRQRGDNVLHGVIREVSLVLAGANPGAYIENVSISHADGSYTEVEDEAVIYGDQAPELCEEISHEEASESEESKKTVQDVFNTLNEEQKTLFYAMMAEASGESDDVEHSEKGGEIMKFNVFEGQAKETAKDTLTHAEFQSILTDAKKCGSLKEAFLSHAGETNGTAGVDYGITNIELLFPDYRNVRDTPDFIKRDDEWVAGVIAGTNKTPFSRIRTMTADITAEVARARGYKKGHLKKEEVIKLAKRVTGPTTIYKKQRLDRDDIIDITSFDVVTWLKAEMQGMLREELARAILVGDGRDSSSEDKIDEACIRPIYKEEELYAFHEEIDMSSEDNNEKYLNLIDSIALAMIDYRGSGAPTFYTTKHTHTMMKMIRDKLGRKLYESDAALVDALGVSKIVDVPIMEGLKNDDKRLIGIIVNLKDYTVGTNRGGETTFFDDFDIDYNQYKYLYETRLSGALTRPDCAIILEATGDGIPL